MQELFRKFATRVADITGRVYVFILAVAVILVWAITGPLFKFADTWQLIINTGTTIVTFLMVFLIQNTQNRDAAAIHTKLDELIFHTKGAHNELAEAEEMTEEELQHVKRHIDELAKNGGTGEVKGADSGNGKRSTTRRKTTRRATKSRAKS